MKGEKDAKKLARMAEKLKHMTNRWADNHEHMELLTKVIDESATGAAAAVYILQEVKKSKRKQGYAEAEWAKGRR